MTFEELCEKYPGKLHGFEIKNALVESATITNADHGVLNARLMLSYGGGMKQGFGGFRLYQPLDKDDNQSVSFDSAGHFLWRSLEIAGVSQWDRVAGRPLRVMIAGSLVRAIGHFLEDDWFCPQVDFAVPTALEG